MAKRERVEEMNYEDALAELEALVGSMESGEYPLEETLIRYERGRQLVKHCNSLLEKAELKIRELNADIPPVNGNVP